MHSNPNQHSSKTGYFTQTIQTKKYFVHKIFGQQKLKKKKRIEATILLWQYTIMKT